MGRELDATRRKNVRTLKERRYDGVGHGNLRAVNEGRIKLREAWSMGESNEPGGHGSLIFPPELLLLSAVIIRGGQAATCTRTNF